jgi:hypothetical protein
MNNLFKSNSRFSALADETDNNKQKNNKKDDKNKKDEINIKKDDSKPNRFEEKEINNRFKNSFESIENKEERPRDNRRNQFQKPVVPQVIIKVEEKPVINVDDFTTSLTKSKSTAKAEEKKPTLSFAEKAARNCNIGEIVKFVHVEKPKPKPLTDEETQNKIKEQQMAYDVLNGLCDLYERRTAMYIERYGYDAWERTFKFEGWEEEEAYNQKLDDDYEEWLEKEEEREQQEEEKREREEEYLANNDRYVNYWKYY